MDLSCLFSPIFFIIFQPFFAAHKYAVPCTHTQTFLPEFTVMASTLSPIQGKKDEREILCRQKATFHVQKKKRKETSLVLSPSGHRHLIPGHQAVQRSVCACVSSKGESMSCLPVQALNYALSDVSPLLLLSLSLRFLIKLCIWKERERGKSCSGCICAYI